MRKPAGRAAGPVWSAGSALSCRRAPERNDSGSGGMPGEGQGMAETIGFIGLGAMGGGMAANLLKAGFALVVNDIDSARVAALVARGAQAAATAADVARQSARTVTMV